MGKEPQNNMYIGQTQRPQKKMYTICTASNSRTGKYTELSKTLNLPTHPPSHTHWCLSIQNSLSRRHEKHPHPHHTQTHNVQLVPCMVYLNLVVLHDRKHIIECKANHDSHTPPFRNCSPPLFIQTNSTKTGILYTQDTPQAVNSNADTQGHHVQPIAFTSTHLQQHTSRQRMPRLKLTSLPIMGSGHYAAHNTHT